MSEQKQNNTGADANSAGRTPLTSRIVELFLTGNLSVMLIVVSLIGGAIALMVTPREEDPQIVVEQVVGPRHRLHAPQLQTRTRYDAERALCGVPIIHDRSICREVESA